MLNSFTENLKDILRLKGISQKEIAEQLLVRPSAVNQWIKGKREPDLDTLLRICVILDTPPNEMLGFEKSKTYIELQNLAIKQNNKIRTMSKQEKKEWLNSWEHLFNK